MARPTSEAAGSAVPLWAGAATAVLGLMGLAGWVFDVAALRSITPDLPSMKANTAIAFVLTGTALVLLRRPTAHPYRRVAGAVCGASVGLIGLVTLGEYVFGYSGIDILLFADVGELPGRPAPQTAAGFVVTGVALLSVALATGWSDRIFPILLGGLALLTLAAVIGYLYGLEYLRGVSAVTGMSVAAVACFALTLLGLAWLRTDRGVPAFLASGRPSAQLVRRFGPVVLVLPAVMGLLRLGGESADVYDPAVGIAGLTLATVAMFGVLLLLAGRHVDHLEGRRQEAQRLAWAGEQTYRTIAERAEDAIITADQHGVVVYANPGATRLFGYPLHELEGKPLQLLMPGRYRERHTLAFSRFVVTGTRSVVTPFQTEALRSDGTEVDVELSLDATRVNGDIRFTAIIRDISGRRGAERLFRELLEAAPEPMVVVDRTGTILLVNSQAERLFGYEADQMRGHLVEMLVPDRLRGTHVTHRHEFFAHPSTRPMGAGRELVARHADGHDIPVEISLSPVQTEFGLLASVAVRDITDSEARFRRLFEAAPIGMAVMSLDGQLQRVNEQLAGITGYTVEQLQGTSLPDITYLEDLAAEEQAILSLAAGQAATHRVEERLVRAGGESVWVSLSVALVRDAEGRPNHLVAQIQDISTRKHLEAQLRYQADHDVLTGLLNRRRFTDELTRQLADTRRHGTPAALLSLDLDDFKDVNDSLGHAAGDEIIMRVGELCSERLRATDTCARFGGDEFAVLLTHADPREARLVAAQILDAIRRSDPVPLPSGPRRLTASIGIAPLPQSTDLTTDDVLVQADIALYDAKEAGRDQACVYDPARARRPRMQPRVT